MYVELMVAAVAALMWSVSGPGAVSDLCFNVLLMAGVSTLLFNANPLMRFDGYYILSDLVGLPNLAGLGRMAAADLARRGLLGMPSRGLHLTRRARLLVTAYGLAAWCWSLLVAASLIMGAALLFHGAGIVLAAAGVVLWWGLPLGRACRGLLRPGGLSAAHRRRGAVRLAAAAIVVAILLVGLPAPWLQRTPALVEYAPLTILRAQAPGLVSRVHVVSGQRVETGQLLVELDNEQLHQELRDLDLALEQSAGRLRTLRNREQLAALEAELAEHKNLTDRREEKRREAAHLEVDAPCPGQVLTPHPEQLVGTYADIGRELVALGDEDHKELVLSIDQEDIASFQKSLAQPVSARVRGLGRQSGVLYRVAPAASTRPPSEAFCANAGGPVPVTTEDRTEDGGKVSIPVFIQPRFDAAVQLTVEQSRQLRAGQRATVWPATRGPALAVSAYRAVRGWWRAHGKT
jgi:putative peptide zinc metalloprotease protein